MLGPDQSRQRAHRCAGMSLTDTSSSEESVCVRCTLWSRLDSPTRIFLTVSKSDNDHTHPPQGQPAGTRSTRAGLPAFSFYSQLEPGLLDLLPGEVRPGPGLPA